MNLRECDKSEDGKHEWQTKYSTRLGVDGVEWFCANCRNSLDWPTAKKWVNAHAQFQDAIEQAFDLLTNIPEDTPKNWNHVNESIQEAHDILEAVK